MRFNSCFRVFSLVLHGLMCVVGLCMVGLCLYIILADWGDLGRSFFLATGVVMGLVGLVILFTSKIGCQGINAQMRSFGFWSGQRILFFYTFLELLALAAVLYLIVYAQSTLVAFNDNYHALEDGETDVSFAPFEYTLSDKFNSFFFGASNGCRVQYEWFWRIVDSSCPSPMHSSSCQACNAYSITMCSADESACYRDDSTSSNSIDNNRCPYTLCRAGMLHFMSSNAFSRGFLGVLIAFAVLQLLSIAVSVKLATFEFRNVGTIRVVPIDGYDDDIVTVTAPPIKLHSQSS